MNISIRSARVDEVKILQDLNDEIFIDNQKYDSDLRFDWAQSEDGGKKYFAELLKNDQAICLIANVDQKIVGYIAASSKEVPYRNSNYIEVENMGIIPAFRSLGIGRLLMEKCLQIAKKLKYNKVYVNVYFQNKKAINFYKQNGFSEIDLCLEKKL